jgi:hypothetical protein
VSEAPARPQASRPALNGGDRQQRLLYGGAAYTVLAGLTSIVLGLLDAASTAGAILGVTGFLIGMIAQMMSVTRAERMFIVVGITASFVGMGLGIAHGGF